MSKNLFSKIAKLVQRINNSSLFTQAERESLAVILSGEDGGVSPELKLKTYEALLLMRRKLRKPFGMLLVLGWRREWNEKYAAIPDITQNIFEEKRFDILGHSPAEIYKILKKTADFDGALLANTDGVIISSGVYLEGMKPKEVANALYPEKTEDLSMAFGFMSKVHTRHLCAIAGSYRLNGTTIFVISEEDRSLRVFESGQILWSTHRSEVKEIIETL